MACLRLLTFPPFPPGPDLKVPFFRRRMALSTLFDAALPYRGLEDDFFLGDDPVAIDPSWLNSPVESRLPRNPFSNVYHKTGERSAVTAHAVAVYCHTIRAPFTVVPNEGLLREGPPVGSFEPLMVTVTGVGPLLLVNLA